MFLLLVSPSLRFRRNPLFFFSLLDYMRLSLGGYWLLFLVLVNLVRFLLVSAVSFRQVFSYSMPCFSLDGGGVVVVWLWFNQWGVFRQVFFCSAAILLAEMGLFFWSMVLFLCLRWWAYIVISTLRVLSDKLFVILWLVLWLALCLALCSSKLFGKRKGGVVVHAVHWVFARFLLDWACPTFFL